MEKKQVTYRRTPSPSQLLPSFVPLFLLAAVTACGGESESPKDIGASGATAVGAGGSGLTASTTNRGGTSGTPLDTRGGARGDSTGTEKTTGTPLGSGGSAAPIGSSSGGTYATSSQVPRSGGATATSTVAPSSGGATATSTVAPSSGGTATTAIAGVGGVTSTLTKPNNGGSSDGAGGASVQTGGTGAAGKASGGTSSSSSSTSKGTDVLVSTYVTPYCTKLSECCTKAGFVAPTAAACANRELDFYAKSLLDGTASVNDAGVKALLSAVQNSCDQPSYGLYANLTVGTLPVGSTCTDVAQCAGDNMMCQIITTATSGKCVALSRGKLGSACASNCDNSSVCRFTLLGALQNSGTAVCWDEDGLRCDSNTGTCVALSGIGKGCDFGTCGAHADCYNDVCRAKGKLSESCADGRSCESTLICDGDTQTCVKMSIAWSGSCEL